MGYNRKGDGMSVLVKPKLSPLRIIPGKYPTKLKDVIISLLLTAGVIGFRLHIYFQQDYK